MFRPLHAATPSRGTFQVDARFGGALKAPPSPAVRVHDPLSDAWDDGFRAAAAQVRDDMAQVAAANAEIELAYAKLTDVEGEAIAEKLREIVIALCGAVLEDAAIDTALLEHRIAKAMALLRRNSDEKILRVHPDDLALIGARLPPGLEARADPALDRGALRIETAAGGVEDGPAQWREAITAAVRAC